MRHPHGCIALALCIVLLHDLGGSHVVACRNKLFIALCPLHCVSLDSVVVGHSDGVGWGRDFTTLRSVLTFRSAISIADPLRLVALCLVSLHVKTVQEVVEHLLACLSVLTLSFLLWTGTSLSRHLHFLRINNFDYLILLIQFVKFNLLLIYQLSILSFLSNQTILLFLYLVASKGLGPIQLSFING